MHALIYCNLYWVEYSEHPQEDGCVWTESKYSYYPCTAKQRKENKCTLEREASNKIMDNNGNKKMYKSLSVDNSTTQLTHTTSSVFFLDLDKLAYCILLLKNEVNVIERKTKFIWCENKLQIMVC